MVNHGIGPNVLPLWVQAGYKPTFQITVPPNRAVHGEQCELTIAGNI